MQLLPEFDKIIFVGNGCSKLRANIQAYNFDVVHGESKSSGAAIDMYLSGHNEAGVLLWSGDVEAARAGWRKQIEARKKIAALVQKGERSWG